MPDERSHEFTRDRCATVLGWTFPMTLPTPNGDYHLFAYSESGGVLIGFSGPTD
jgi:hypothetical protein